METGPYSFLFSLGLKWTHIPQLRGLVLGCNTPPTSVTQALIPLATDEEGLFQQPCILSFCGSMGCQDPFTLCVRLCYPAEALGPSLFSPYDKIIPFHSLYKQPFLGPVTLLLPGPWCQSPKANSVSWYAPSLFHPQCTQVHWPQCILWLDSTKIVWLSDAGRRELAQWLCGFVFCVHRVCYRHFSKLSPDV